MMGQKFVLLNNHWRREHKGDIYFCFKKDGNNNGRLSIANATSGGACKSAWANGKFLTLFVLEH